PPAPAPFDVASQDRLALAVLRQPAVLLAELAQNAVVQSASLPVSPTAPRRARAIGAAPPRDAVRTNRAVAPPFPAFAQLAENAGQLRNNHRRPGPAAL